jgi:uncharacterized protein (TIGR00255 family)
MPLISMTGFARVDGELNDLRWHWEIRSVNGKGLESRFRLPGGWEGIETRLREELSKQLKRGNCQITLSLDRLQGAAPLRLNQQALQSVMDAVASIKAKYDLAPPSVDGILALKGVLENAEGDEEDEEQRLQIEKALIASFSEVVFALARARAEEGIKLEVSLREHVGRIEALTLAAATSPAASLEAMRTRLKTQVGELLGASPILSEERLTQEAAQLAIKADIREEIDRLRAHIEQALGLFASHEPVGRRLDFLAQEFNREANTLCSKAVDVSLTRIGLDLKAVIDQLREQVQNVE